MRKNEFTELKKTYSIKECCVTRPAMVSMENREGVRYLVIELGNTEKISANGIQI